MHSLRWIAVLGMAVFLAPCVPASPQDQESLPPAPPASAKAQTSAPAPGKPGKQKHTHVSDFLIRGSVFDDKGLSFPGAQLRIRRSGAKKFRWESTTNSRGDFAVRVPQGPEYEMVVHAKGFIDQTRAIDTKSGGNEIRLAFRIVPAAGGKK